MGFLKQMERRQEGQVLILTITILALSGLMIAPLLNFMGTGLNAASLHRDKTNQLYAADAGIQDGVWRIANAIVPQTANDISL